MLATGRAGVDGGRPDVCADEDDGSLPPMAGARDAVLVHPFMVGTLRCIALSDGIVPVPATLLAVEVPPDELKAFLRANGQDPDVLLNPISCLAVTLADGRSMIVDSGIGSVSGPDGAPIPSAGRFAEAVRQAGIDPAAVEIVLVSHVHPDHIGGLFDAAGQPLFANAEYCVSRQEVEFWTDVTTDLGGTLMPPPLRVKTIATARRFLQLAGDRLRQFEAGEAVVDGVATIALPGHTPGQVGFVFDGGGGEKLFYTADAAGHPFVSLRKPEWRFAFDTDSPLAVATRRRMVRHLIDTKWYNFTPHFPWPAFGRIVEREAVPVWVPGLR